jgi:hypothetical protein
MKIVLFALNSSYSHTNLAIRCLRPHLLEGGFEVRLAEGNLRDTDGSLLDMLVAEKGDIYGFSCYIWNLTQTLEIAETIAKYGNLQNEDLENGIMSKKDYALQLTERLMKPLYSKYGSSIPKHTALSLQLTNEFYWEKVVLPLTETSDFIPNIYDYFSLLGISKQTFDNYQRSGTEEMRETCEMILDKFIGYYQRKGMKKECDTIMAMFTLKTTFRQRENDVPQVVVANINTTAQERIDKYARQYGFDTWNGGE